MPVGPSHAHSMLASRYRDIDPLWQGTGDERNAISSYLRACGEALDADYLLEREKRRHFRDPDEIGVTTSDDGGEW